MAISLGDAALAFAGGAAQQYNKMADEERKAKTDRQKRVQELLDAAAVKQSETEYAKEVTDHHKLDSLYEAFKTTGGPNTRMGQQAIADYYGWDLAKVVRSGQFGTLTAPERGKAPIPLTDRMASLASSDYEPGKLKYSNRTRQTTVGKMYDKDGKAIPRGVGIGPDGKAIQADVVTSLGEDLNSPAWMVTQDLSKLSAEDRMEIGNAMIGDSNRKVEWDSERGVFLVINEDGTNAKVIKPEGMIEGAAVPESEDTMMSLQEQVDYYDKKIQSGDTSRDWERAKVDTIDLIDKKKKESGLTPTDIENRNRISRRVGDIRSNLTQLSTMRQNIKDYKDTSTAEGEGAAGALRNLWDTFGRNVRGFAELTGAAESKSLTQMEEELKEAGVNIDEWIKTNDSARAGANRMDKVLVLYSLASINKNFNQERLSNQDTKYAQEAISGFGEEGRLAQMNRIEKLLNRKIAAYQLEYYTMEGVGKYEKRDAGVGFLNTLGWKFGDDYLVGPDQTVYIKVQDEEGIEYPMPLDDYLLANPSIRYGGGM